MCHCPFCRKFDKVLLKFYITAVERKDQARSHKSHQIGGDIIKNLYISIGKNRQNGIDKEKFTYSYTVLEADGFKDVIEKICCVIKFEPSADGGSICKTTNTYYPKGGAQISEEHLKGGKEKGLGMVKAVEAYLHANPTAYN